MAALVAATGAWAAPSFSAHGSAEQVYVTGLAANAQMSLITSGGKTLYTQDADSLGGLLFRNVAARKRLPGAARLGRVGVGPDHGPLGRGQAVGSEHLQPIDPGQRLHVPDDA